MEPWYEGSTRAPHVFLTGFGPWGGKVLQGSTGFHKGPPRWFHHFYRFRKGCSTKVFTRFCTGFHEAEVRFYKAPQFHKGSTNLLWREAMRRAPSESQWSSQLRAQEIALLMGGTLSKTERFQDTAQNNRCPKVCGLGQTFSLGHLKKWFSRHGPTQ